MNVFVIAENYNATDLEGAHEEEKELEEIFQDLNIDMNIFSTSFQLFHLDQIPRRCWPGST